MILVDTSVWINHLRQSDEKLKEQLINGAVVMHPFVIGELACGNLHNRREILGLLKNLPSITIATDNEVLYFIEEKGLMGKGLGYIDIHLLASVRLAHYAQLWTKDKRLAKVATALGVGFIKQH